MSVQYDMPLDDYRKLGIISDGEIGSFQEIQKQILEGVLTSASAYVPFDFGEETRDEFLPDRRPSEVDEVLARDALRDSPSAGERLLEAEINILADSLFDALSVMPDREEAQVALQNFLSVQKGDLVIRHESDAKQFRIEMKNPDDKIFIDFSICIEDPDVWHLLYMDNKREYGLNYIHLDDPVTHEQMGILRRVTPRCRGIEIINLEDPLERQLIQYLSMFGVGVDEIFDVVSFDGPEQDRVLFRNWVGAVSESG